MGANTGLENGAWWAQCDENGTHVAMPVDKDIAIAGLFGADVGCAVIPSQLGGNNCSHPLFGALCPVTCGEDASTVADWSLDNDDIVLPIFGGTCKQLIDATAGGQCFDSTGRTYTAVGALCPESCEVPLTLPACKCAADWKDGALGSYCPSTVLGGCPANDCTGGDFGYVLLLLLLLLLFFQLLLLCCSTSPLPLLALEL